MTERLRNINLIDIVVNDFFELVVAIDIYEKPLVSRASTNGLIQL